MNISSKIILKKQELSKIDEKIDEILNRKHIPIIGYLWAFLTTEYKLECYKYDNYKLFSEFMELTREEIEINKK